MSPGVLASAFAPGKLILTGEHAVVRGQPAVAMAVNRGCRVRLHRRAGASGIDRAPISDTRLQKAVRASLPSNGIGVEITSDLPIGRGMGSSAAVSVALVEALAAIDEEVLDFTTLHARGFALERIFHGEPSGIDHAVSALGGIVHYRQHPEGPRLGRLHGQLPPIVVIDSGRSGNTAEQVAKVRASEDGGARICAKIGELTHEWIRAFEDKDPVTMGERMTENHGLLARLGVSTPELDALVEIALKAGAHGAKLAGAGGGGVVIAAATNPEAVLAAAERAGYTAFVTRMHPKRMELP